MNQLFRMTIRVTPASVKNVIKKFVWAMLDLVDLLSGKRDPLIPPRSMIFVGDGDFKEVGNEFKRLFQELGHLEPHHRVLDVGCGIGRIAVPLVGFLSNRGGYWGFDIVAEGIEWCQKNITSKYPNFHFTHSDIQNKFYNPLGKYQASTYKFPYETGFFDFIFLTSVFTHMFPEDLDNYLKEICRVLKPWGTCFITFFLLNNESEGLIRKGASSQKFVYDLNGCFTTDKVNPEVAIAYKETDIRDLFKKYQIAISEPVRFGSWCGREKYLSYQDIILAIKK